MIGRRSNQYTDVGDMWIYDTDIDDWEFPPIPTPFSTATYNKLVSTPHGIVAWGFAGSYYHSNLWLYDEIAETWSLLAEELPMIGYTYEDGSLMYDPPRDRLLIHTSKTNATDMTEYSFADDELRDLNPDDSKLGNIGSINSREWSYVDDLDIFFFSHSVDASGSRYIVYNPAANKWDLYEVDESVFRTTPGYSSSFPFCFDSKRKLIFAIKPSMKTYVLKLSGTTGEFRPRCTLPNCNDFSTDVMLEMLSCWKEGEMSIVGIMGAISEWKGCG